MDLDDQKNIKLKKSSSLGSTIVNERVELLNEMGYQIKMDTESLDGLGTKVMLTIYEKY